MARSDSATREWPRARLLSTSGIRGTKDQEQRATSALLAVMSAVTPFGRELVAELGGPRGRIETYTEVPLHTPDGGSVYPDGAIVARRGKTVWSALVEVKTGNSSLDADQVVCYLDAARSEGFDGVLIINNDILGGADDVPISVPKKKLRTVSLWQLSWWRIVTEAVIQHEHRGVSDPEQAWILGELIAYLMHERSGAGELDDMGPSWTTVRDGARHETLSRGQSEVRDVARRWEQFVHYAALGLTQDLGEEVVPARVKRQLGQRIDQTVEELVDQGCLTMQLKVPRAVGPMELCADLRTRMVTTSVALKAPGEGRPDTRVRWVLRQLREAPEDLRVEVRFENTSKSVSALLGEVRDDAQKLLLNDDPKRNPRQFRLSLSRSMGTKRHNKSGSFIAETRRQAIDFYRELVQNLVEWQPRAPKLRQGSKRTAAAETGEAGRESATASGDPAQTGPDATGPEWIAPPVDDTSEHADSSGDDDAPQGAAEDG
jgi:hypothetical protein